MNKLNQSDDFQPLLVLGYLKAHRITQEQVAETLKINRTTVNRKLHNNGAFTIREAQILNRSLGIPLTLFFDNQ